MHVHCFSSEGILTSSLSLSTASTLARTKSSAPGLYGQGNGDDVQDEPSAARKDRLEKEKQLSKRFATGEELKNLRVDLESLRHNLQWAEALKDETRIESLERAIKNGEKRDPDLMYTKAQKMISQAKTLKDETKEAKEAVVEKWTKIASSARECLPQFNLEGLWVGR